MLRIIISTLVASIIFLVACQNDNQSDNISTNLKKTKTLDSKTILNQEQTTTNDNLEENIDYKKYVGIWKPNKTALDTTLYVYSYDGKSLKGEFFSVYGQGANLSQAEFECTLEDNKGSFEMEDSFSNKLNGTIEVDTIEEIIIASIEVVQLVQAPIEDGEFIFTKKHNFTKE